MIDQPQPQQYIPRYLPLAELWYLYGPQQLLYRHTSSYSALSSRNKVNERGHRKANKQTLHGSLGRAARR